MLKRIQVGECLFGRMDFGLADDSIKGVPARLKSTPLFLEIKILPDVFLEMDAHEMHFLVMSDDIFLVRPWDKRDHATARCRSCTAACRTAKPDSFSARPGRNNFCDRTC